MFTKCIGYNTNCIGAHRIWLRNDTSTVCIHQCSLYCNQYTLKKCNTELIGRVLVNSKFVVFYPNFLALTPTFCKASIEKYSKTPTFSGRQHFYSYFQNSSENCLVVSVGHRGGEWIVSDIRVCFIKQFNEYILPTITWNKVCCIMGTGPHLKDWRHGQLDLRFKGK